MKRFKQKPVRFDDSELNTDLGKGNFIFVGSSCDLFALTIPENWIEATLYHCTKFQENAYLFQSKNPDRFRRFKDRYPIEVIFGTTIETNREELIDTSCPNILSRYHGLYMLSSSGARTMVTIEPIMDFDLQQLIMIIKDIRPEWVNVGADSQGHGLPEPEWPKVNELLKALEEFTEVKVKKNLSRIMVA
jgi:hypothetical protein